MFNGNMLEMFRSTSDVEVKEIIIQSLNKSCELDPLSNCLLKKCVDQLLPLIIAIVNRSMDESVMPLYLKRATTIPLLKRSGLDKGDMKNYRPISILPFTSKLIEKVVTRCIEEHLEHNNLNDSYTSAYRKGYSTETALLKVQSDISEALGEGSMTAFDVIDHPILLKRFELSFGIKEKALTWIKSYLNDRTQCASVADKTCHM